MIGGQEGLPSIYKEFKTIYKQEFGVDLANEEAYQKAIRLINLAKAIRNHKQNKKLN